MLSDTAATVRVDMLDGDKHIAGATTILDLDKTGENGIQPHALTKLGDVEVMGRG